MLHSRSNYDTAYSNHYYWHTLQLAHALAQIIANRIYHLDSIFEIQIRMETTESIKKYWTHFLKKKKNKTQNQPEHKFNILLNDNMQVLRKPDKMIGSRDNFFHSFFSCKEIYNDVVFDEHFFNLSWFLVFIAHLTLCCYNNALATCIQMYIRIPFVQQWDYTPQLPHENYIASNTSRLYGCCVGPTVRKYSMP